MPPTPSSPAAEPRGRRVALLALVPVIVVVVGALLFVSLRSRHDTAPTVPKDAIVGGKAVDGRPAPRFVATALDGKQVSLASYRGRPLVLSFGASWCHPCRQEYPLLVQALAQHGQRFAILSVMHDDLDPDARAFMQQFHAPWAAINDESNDISTAYGVNAVPQTFFITAQGVVQARVYGITSKGVLDGPLDHLLATG